MQKQRNAMSKALKVMAAGTIVFSSLGAVPFNTLASEVIMPVVATQATDVKTWNELKVALETANITDINLKADITMGANANINGASKTIHGNGYMINANNNLLSIFAEGTAVKVENMMIINTNKYGFISAPSGIGRTVILHNIASSGERLFVLEKATLILEGDISNKSTFAWDDSAGSISAEKIIVREKANVNIETTGVNTYAIKAGQELHVEGGSTLNLSARGSGLMMNPGSKGVIDGKLTTTAKDSNGINMTQAQLTISKTGVWNALNSGRAGLLLAKSQFENNGLVDINGPAENISADNSDVTNFGTMKMYSDGTLDYNLVRVDNGKLTLGTGSRFTFSHKNKLTESSPVRMSVLNVEKGATMEVSANAAKSAVTVLETANFDKGANFSIHNIIGGVLGCFSGTSKINIESDSGFATWNKGNVLSKDPNRFYAGPLYMYFEVTGNESNQKQGNLQSNSSEARVFYDNQNTGKIASGSFVKDPRQVEAENKAREAVNSLFTNKDPNGNIADTVTQADIDAAQALIDQVTDSARKAELQADLNKAQAQLEVKTAQEEAENKAREAVNNLFTNKNPNGNITGAMTQADIDAAQTLINQVTDSAKKNALQADLNKAQSQLDVKTAQTEAENKAYEAVNNLFTNKNPNGNITSSMTQADIDAAQALINKVTDSAKKAALQADLNKAQSQLDAKAMQAEAENKAREAVNDLFTNKDPNGNISSAVTQTAIDAAQTLVNQVTDPTKKAALQKDLDKVKTQFATKGTLKPDDFVLGTTSITGTYSGDVDRITLSKDGVESGNATKTNGTFRFYAGPGIKKEQSLYMVAYDKNGREIAREKVNIAAVTEGNLSPTAMTIPGDSYISGTYTGDVSRIEVSITNEAGVTQLYKGGTVANGTFRFYSFDKTKSPKDIIVVRAYDSVGKLLDTKTVTIKNNVVTTDGKVTPATMTIPGDTTLTGTVSGDVASLRVTVNGTEYVGGSISNGTFKFYTLDKIKKADDNVTIAVYDKTGKLLDSKKVTIQAPTK